MTAGSSTPRLLVLAQHSSLRIHEIPVDWVDDQDSRVDILPTVRADLAGMVRVGRSLALGRLPVAEIRGSFGRGRPGPSVAGVDTRLSGQLVRFTAIGVISTLAYILLYALLRPGMGAQTANLLTLLVTAIANTTANRRLTFGIKGSSGAIRHQGQGLVVFVLGLALTSGALGLLGALGSGADRMVEVATLVAANIAATALRFLLLRVWVFRGSGSVRS
jgi:putative flippase GtrA